MSSAQPPAAFAGWPSEAIAWFEGIEADNSRAWFQANRDSYDRCATFPNDAALEHGSDVALSDLPNPDVTP